MIRHSVVKIGDKLRDKKGDGGKHGAMADKDGSVSWNSEKEGDLDMEMLMERQTRFGSGGARLPGNQGEVD